MTKLLEKQNRKIAQKHKKIKIPKISVHKNTEMKNKELEKSITEFP